MSALPGVDEEPTPTENVLENGLPYVSKSRIKTYLQCPRKFFWKYVCETRPPGTFYTERGTEVHETFEVFHERLIDRWYEEDKRRPSRFTDLLPDRQLWQQWIEMVGNFFAFEERRWDLAARAAIEQPYSEEITTEELAHTYWLPIEVEAEAWLGEPPDDWETDNELYLAPGDPPVGDIPWMGRADLIVDSRTVPEVDGSGVTIIDYKTGTAPTVKYEGKPWLEENLQQGIFLEGEYYGWLFEDLFDVDAVAGYYPENDELIVSPYPDQGRRRDIKRAVLGMQQAPEIGNFDTDESPLCHYNNSKNHGQCYFYPVCPVQRDCADCDPAPTSGSGRYDA